MECLRVVSIMILNDSRRYYVYYVLFEYDIKTYIETNRQCVKSRTKLRVEMGREPVKGAIASGIRYLYALDITRDVFTLFFRPVRYSIKQYRSTYLILRRSNGKL